MDAWSLPCSVSYKGTDWQIHTDYLTVLDVLSIFKNHDLDNIEKCLYCLYQLVVRFDDLQEDDYFPMYEKVREFIDMGQESKNNNTPSVMDWEQDAPLIIPEINKQLGNGLDVRTMPDMHWWTFLGYYMAIGECTYSHILSIRNKRAKGKKLEKWEKEYANENKDIVNLKHKLSEQEKEEKARAQELFNRL